MCMQTEPTAPIPATDVTTGSGTYSPNTTYPAPAPGPCPCCGRCPVCGHGGCAPYSVPQPYYPAPQPFGIYPPILWY